MKINRQGQASVITHTQECDIIAAFAENRFNLGNIALFSLGINTGLRINELRTLKIGDVIDEEGGLRAQFQIAKCNSKNKRPRLVPLNLKAGKALLAYLETRPDAQPHEPLFATQYGTHLAISACHRLFEEAFEKCKLEGYSTHSMRRTFITRLHNLGTKIGVISKLAGHSGIGVTSRYVEITEDQQRAAIDSL